MVASGRPTDALLDHREAIGHRLEAGPQDLQRRSGERQAVDRRLDVAGPIGASFPGEEGQYGQAVAVGRELRRDTLDLSGSPAGASAAASRRRCRPRWSPRPAARAAGRRGSTTARAAPR